MAQVKISKWHTTFCISVGLVLDNEIVSGVIFDPIKDEIYYAEKIPVRT